LQIAFDVVKGFQTEIQTQWLLSVIQSSNLPSILKSRFASQAVDGW
jgi:hypothetical protein